MKAHEEISLGNAFEIRTREDVGRYGIIDVEQRNGL